MPVQEIDLGYEPRAPFIPYHQRNQRQSVIVAHRRAGKTVACLVDQIVAAIFNKRNRAQYGFISPQLKQAKANAWGYLKDYGLRIPGSTVHENELRLNLPNGAMIRLFGSDNIDAFRGMYFDGVVLDEYGDIHPRLLPEILLPALGDRRGWYTLIGTPKGPNDFYDKWQEAQGDPKFFSLMLRTSQNTSLTEEDWAEIRRIQSGQTPEQFAREFECSFAAPNVGAYYGKEMETALKEERILGKVYSHAHEVHTAWDLGVNDMTVIWFFQKVGMQIWLIDYFSGTDHGLDHYAKVLQDRGYKYGRHYFPHDVEQRHQGKGVIAHSRRQMLADLGIAAEVIERNDVADGISAVRKILPRCVFDKDKCAEGIKAMQLYHREFDEERKVYIEHPYKDWTADPADAFRILAMSIFDKPATTSGNKVPWMKKAKDRLNWIV